MQIKMNRSPTKGLLEVKPEGNVWRDWISWKHVDLKERNPSLASLITVWTHCLELENLFQKFPIRSGLLWTCDVLLEGGGGKTEKAKRKRGKVCFCQNWKSYPSFKQAPLGSSMWAQAFYPKFTRKLSKNSYPASTNFAEYAVVHSAKTMGLWGGSLAWCKIIFAKANSFPIKRKAKKANLHIGRLYNMKATAMRLQEPLKQI